MKKALFATTAIVAAGFATTATSAEWETGVSGYYYLGLGLSDAAGQDGLGIVRDGEIHVNGRLTADNGLTFRARVEVEAHTQAGDQMDENWGSVSGSFGTIMIGGNDDAVYNNHVGVIYAPGARVGYFDPFNITTAGGAFYNRAGFGSDQIGIHYTTPNFMGFQAYGSYHPSFGTSDGSLDGNGIFFEGADFYAVGASYNGDFGDFGIGLSAGFSDLQGTPGAEMLTFGANVSFGGFTLAGTFEDDFVGEDIAIGAQYSTGPWTIAGGYTMSDANAGEVDHDVAVGWVTYAAAPGVLFTLGLEYADVEGDGQGGDFGGLGYMTLRF